MMAEINRCAWPGKDALYLSYHDEEWGVPVHDDHKMFEFLLLETFQAGLSWITILRKRENFREAFSGFNYREIAEYSEDDVQRLLQNSGIIRNKAKIKAAINNARAYISVAEEHGSFCHYLWSFTDHRSIQNDWEEQKEVPASTPLSDRISADLKKRGFKFVGSTTIYAHLQACGIVNDHLQHCFRHAQLQ